MSNFAAYRYCIVQALLQEGGKHTLNTISTFSYFFIGLERILRVMRESQTRMTHRDRQHIWAGRLSRSQVLTFFHALYHFDFFFTFVSYFISVRYVQRPKKCFAESGCPPIVEPDNAKIIYLDSNASALLFCEPNFEIVGSRNSYCNGKEWDRKIGTCRETDNAPMTFCDFESESLIFVLYFCTFLWKHTKNTKCLFSFLLVGLGMINIDKYILKYM